MGDGARYATHATPYYVRMKSGYQTLIGLSDDDYRMLLAQGFGDEEVYVSLSKEGDASHGCDLEVRAGLNTITVDGKHLFQLCLDAEPTEQMRDRGFKEGRSVALTIRQSPYRIPSHQLKPEDVALDVFDENDPMLDAPEVWLDQDADAKGRGEKE